VRIRSIFRKLDAAFDAAACEVILTEQEELHLARLLVRFGEVVPSIVDDFKPNLLANYLLELARAFHSFFEACPVLKAAAAVRSSRLALCDLTSRTLQQGLHLLGINVPDKM